MSKNKRRILLVSPYNASKVGGIGTWSQSVLDFFSKADTPYRIIFQNTANVFKGNLQNGSLRRIVLGTLDAVSILWKLFWNLLTQKPDVVHYTSSASLALGKDMIALFLTRFLFHKRFVIHWHFGRIPELSREKNREYRNLIKVIKKADVSIVLDRNSLDVLKQEGITNVVAIPNPLTESIYEASKDMDVSSLAAKRENGTVLFVGHIIKTKGVYELVKACTHSDFVQKLIMIGPSLPEAEEELKEIAKNKKKGEWLYFKGELKREYVFEYYMKCSVFCLPSYTEGFPYVILEAMAFGCPIIATRVGAIEEMLDHDAGLVIKPKSERAIFNVLNELLSDKMRRNDIGNNAYNRVMSKYTNDVIFENYYKVWNN